MPPTVAQIRTLVLAGGLMQATDLDVQLADWQLEQGAMDDGPAFARSLVRLELITPFQGEALQAGLSGPYRLGPYHVFDRIAAGPHGLWYHALHEDYQQAVALKVYPPPSPELGDRSVRTARELRVALQVSDPHTVRAFHLGRLGELAFLATEDLVGSTLQDRLQIDFRLSADEACQIALDVALGLQHLHSLNIIHRGLEPSAIWVTWAGRAKLLEYGWAMDSFSFLDEPAAGEPETSDRLVGHLDYLPPEQGADPARADARSDVYGLGCLLFRCLTGRVVFPERNPIRKALQHAWHIAPRADACEPTVPSAVADVVAAMLAKDPDERFQTAADAAAALSHLLRQSERESLVSQEVNPDFLAWARHAKEFRASAPQPTSPELFRFMQWLAAENVSPDDDEVEVDESSEL